MTGRAKMANKIVLLGAKGMLGTEVRSLYADENLKAFDLPEFDISDKLQLRNAIERNNGTELIKDLK
jgi:dTDP-4-dehydrorhamnose reductase